MRLLSYSWSRPAGRLLAGGWRGQHASWRRRRLIRCGLSGLCGLWLRARLGRLLRRVAATGGQDEKWHQEQDSHGLHKSSSQTL